MVLLEERKNRFLEEASRAGKIILEEASDNLPVLVFGHHDADGIAAAAIAAKVLYRCGLPFQIRLLKRVEEEEMEKASSSNRFTILCDMGSGYLSLLSKYSWAGGLVVLDHHKPELIDPPSGCIHVNPHLYGVDGGTEVSGAGVTYVTFRSLSRIKTNDLSVLAIVGALGDMQDSGVGRSFVGVNRFIVEEAIKANYLETSRDLLLPGRETKPLHISLASLMNPFIPGLSGDEDACIAFLSKLGLSLKESGKWRVPAGLSREEKQALFNGLLRYMAEKGHPSSGLKKLIGSVYTLRREKRFSPTRDGREYASLLNACSRMGFGGLALALALGDRRSEMLEEAEKIFSEYRAKIADYVRRVISETGKLVSTGKFYLIRGLGWIEDDMLSVVATITAESYLSDTKLPVIAVAETERGELKVSARLPRAARDKPLDLGSIMKKAASRVGGEGGGHREAAGAYIAKDRFEDFLLTLEEELGKLES